MKRKIAHRAAELISNGDSHYDSLMAATRKLPMKNHIKKASEKISEASLSLELMIGVEPTTCSLRMWANAIGE